jgi:carbamoyltransferase
MNILGMNFSHDGAVAVVKNGRLTSALATERVTREKKSFGVTFKTIEAVLQEASLKPEDISCIALADYKANHSNSVLALRDSDGNTVERTDYSLYNNDVRTLNGVFLGTYKIPVYVLPHHLAHASSAYYTSGFERALCFSLDSSFGELPDNSMVYFGEGTKLTAQMCPALISGIGYAIFTELLGFKPAYSKAGTTMGLSSYGEPLRGELFDEVLKSQWFSVEQHAELEYRQFWSQVWERLIAKHPHELSHRESRDLAATAQAWLEDSVLETLATLHQIYPQRNLCLSGGSMLNCILNTRIARTQLWENIHHFPACGDDGNAVGAALWVAHHMFGAPRQHYQPQELSYLGPTQTTTLTVDYQRVAELLRDGAVVAWHWGKSEYGPRALGHRSLLASATSYHTRERLNFVVKNREWFRPIAPVVLQEHAHEWFDLAVPSSPYMLYTAQVLKPLLIPAVCHVDNSARPQTVSLTQNPQLHQLLTCYHQLTGIPVLCNTSLNGAGEPIMETPEHSLRFFETNDGVDALVLNGQLMERK